MEKLMESTDSHLPAPIVYIWLWWLHLVQVMSWR